MGRMILAVLLAVISSNAMAKWVKVRENNETIFYYNPASVRLSGDRASLIQLSNFKEAETTGTDAYLSSKSQVEFDCKESQARRLVYSLYARHMAKGRVIYTGKNIQEWRPVSPGSPMGDYLEIACKNW
jgi:Surface-adhesin protein E